MKIGKYYLSNLLNESKTPYRLTEHVMKPMEFWKHLKMKFYDPKCIGMQTICLKTLICLYQVHYQLSDYLIQDIMSI